MSLDLEKLKKQLDESLDEETTESLLEWLNNKRTKTDGAIAKSDVDLLVSLRAKSDFEKEIAQEFLDILYRKLAENGNKYSEVVKRLLFLSQEQNSILIKCREFLDALKISGNSVDVAVKLCNRIDDLIGEPN